MTESETEDEILARIETALQKIGAVGKPKPTSSAPNSSGQVQDGLNRDRAMAALDAIIGRLREGLEPPGPDSATGHHTE